MPDIILGNLPQASALTGAERIPMDQRVGGTLAATALTPGLGYAIVSVGTTNWVTCGVPAGVTPVVGLVFTCQTVGTGTGTAQQVETVDAAASDVAALAPVPATDLSYNASTRLLSSSTGTDVTLPLATSSEAGLLPPTGTALTLQDLTVAGTLTAGHIHGALAGPLYIHVRNDAGVSLPAGTTVHVVGNQGDTDRMLVVLARSDDASTMPANGILLTSLAANGSAADGHAVVLGEILGLNTAAFTAGSQLYVAAAGGLTLTRPATNPQVVATVGRVHATTGSILVNCGPLLNAVAFSGAYGDLSGRPPEISQADAEAGSSTTASLWSPQRWRQAAAAWWQSITGATGRSLAAAATAAEARTTLQLGSAAQAATADFATAEQGALAATAVQGNDARLSNARTPLFAATSIYTASGAIATTDRVAVINAASAVTMTLGSGANDGYTLLIKRWGAGAVTISASLDGSNMIIIANSTNIKESVLLAWSSSFSTWMII